MKTYYHVTLESNINSILENGLIAQSGKLSSQMNDFGVFLFPSFEDLETAMMNWLGDEFEEEDGLLYIIVNLPESWDLQSDVEFEVNSMIDIPAKYIVDILNEDMISIKDDLPNQHSMSI